jgi:hypothetical protein
MPNNEPVKDNEEMLELFKRKLKEELGKTWQAKFEALEKRVEVLERKK